jgi:hypothetical protein
MLGGMAKGFALGALWGATARIFMRLFAEVPDFSWAGTLAIVGLSALMGAALGLVREARASGRRRWWRLAPVPTLVLFAGPGLLLLPGVLAAALSARLSRWSLRLAVSALGVAVTTWLAFAAEGHGRSPLALTPALVLVAGCTFAAGLGWGQVLGRWTPSARDMSAGAVAAVPAPAG